MNCLTCGMQVTADQTYCRACGSPLNDSAPPERRTGNLVFLGFAVMFLGVAVGVVGKVLVHNDFLVVAGVLLALAGMLISVYPYLMPGTSTINAGRSSAGPNLPFRAEPTKQLRPEPAFDQVHSVTENTTDLLKTPGSPRETQALEP